MTTQQRRKPRVKSAPRSTRGAQAAARGPERGVIVDLAPFTVRAGASLLACQILRSHQGPPIAWAIGDEVLVQPLGDGTGVVLGRIEAYDPSASADVRLTATRSLTVSCGDSQLELTAQGKVTVRGVDVVSSARRKNRIKGGSVEIN